MPPSAPRDEPMQRTDLGESEQGCAYPAKRFMALLATAAIRGKQTLGEERANEMSPLQPRDKERTLWGLWESRLEEGL